MPRDLLTLGFDTSAAHCAAALLSGERILAERSEPMQTGQAERLMPLIEELLIQTDISWSDIARIGVGIGPGNFTGVRISVAAARGLALALQIPAIGVSGFAALGEAGPRPMLAALNARRGSSWLQVLDTNDNGPFAATPDTLPEELRRSGLPVAGHEAAAFAATTGGTAYQSSLPLAVAIARIAARSATPAPRPAPLYMRAADAAPPSDRPPTILP